MTVLSYGMETIHREKDMFRIAVQIDNLRVLGEWIEYQMNRLESCVWLMKVFSDSLVILKEWRKIGVLKPYMWKNVCVVT